MSSASSKKKSEVFWGHSVSFPSSPFSPMMPSAATSPIYVSKNSFLRIRTLHLKFTKEYNEGEVPSVTSDVTPVGSKRKRSQFEEAEVTSFDKETTVAASSTATPLPAERTVIVLISVSMPEELLPWDILQSHGMPTILCRMNMRPDEMVTKNNAAITLSQSCSCSLNYEIRGGANVQFSLFTMDNNASTADGDLPPTSFSSLGVAATLHLSGEEHIHANFPPTAHFHTRREDVEKYEDEDEDGDGEVVCSWRPIIEKRWYTVKEKALSIMLNRGEEEKKRGGAKKHFSSSKGKKKTAQEKEGEEPADFESQRKYAGSVVEAISICPLSNEHHSTNNDDVGDSMEGQVPTATTKSNQKQQEEKENRNSPFSSPSKKDSSKAKIDRQRYIKLKDGTNVLLRQLEPFCKSYGPSLEYLNILNSKEKSGGGGGVKIFCQPDLQSEVVGLLKPNEVKKAVGVLVRTQHRHAARHRKKTKVTYSRRLQFVVWENGAGFSQLEQLLEKRKERCEYFLGPVPVYFTTTRVVKGVRIRAAPDLQAEELGFMECNEVKQAVGRWYTDDGSTWIEWAKNEVVDDSKKANSSTSLGGGQACFSREMAPRRRSITSSSHCRNQIVEPMEGGGTNKATEDIYLIRIPGPTEELVLPPIRWSAPSAASASHLHQVVGEEKGLHHCDSRSSSTIASIKNLSQAHTDSLLSSSSSSEERELYHHEQEEDDPEESHAWRELHHQVHQGAASLSELPEVEVEQGVYRQPPPVQASRNRGSRGRRGGRGGP